MKVLGIDLGSRDVKIAVMDEGRFVNRFKVQTMKFYKDYCNYDNGIIVDLKKLNIDEADVFVSTGYGRNNTNLNKFTPINEIKAHVYGAIYQTALEDFVLLDVGGQDVKVVKVQKSMITDLGLNDKCAASCGRYLENMANVLEIPLEEMTSHFVDPAELNSTCSVFSESELIGKIAEGVEPKKLCAGVNYSLYKRIRPMLTKFKSRNLVISGGVAKGIAIKEFLKQDYEEVICLEDPQFNGAIGCCVYGNLKNKDLGGLICT